MGVNRKPTRPTHTDLALLQREITLLLERLAEFERNDRPAEGEWFPSVDVYECRGKLIVVAEVPGLPPEALRIVHEDNHLMISGERRERRPHPEIATFLCMERPRGRFSRTIPLDFAVDVPNAEARLEGGVLTVTLPRLKDRRGKETVIRLQREQES